MYFMQLWQCTGDKPASKEQSPWICFTAVKLSTLWMSSSRGNNKRNSWSNYQVDKTALNVKKGSDKRHLQLSQALGVRDCGSQAVLPGRGHMGDLNRKSPNSVSAADAILGDTPRLLGLFWEEEKGKAAGKIKKKKGGKKSPQKHRHNLLFPSNSQATPAKCCTYWFYQYYQKDCQMLLKK